MPYNVIARNEGRREIRFCRNAREAVDLSTALSGAGVVGLRFMSTEGVEMTPERLLTIARLEDQQRLRQDRQAI